MQTRTDCDPHTPRIRRRRAAENLLFAARSRSLGCVGSRCSYHDRVSRGCRSPRIKLLFCRDGRGVAPPANTFAHLMELSQETALGRAFPPLTSASPLPDFPPWPSWPEVLRSHENMYPALVTARICSKPHATPTKGSPLDPFSSIKLSVLEPGGERLEEQKAGRSELPLRR